MREEQTDKSKSNNSKQWWSTRTWPNANKFSMIDRNSEWKFWARKRRQKSPIREWKRWKTWEFRERMKIEAKKRRCRSAKFSFENGKEKKSVESFRVERKTNFGEGERQKSDEHRLNRRFEIIRDLFIDLTERNDRCSIVDQRRWTSNRSSRHFSFFFVGKRNFFRHVAKHRKTIFIEIERSNSSHRSRRFFSWRKKKILKSALSVSIKKAKICFRFTRQLFSRCFVERTSVQRQKADGPHSIVGMRVRSADFKTVRTFFGTSNCRYSKDLHVILWSIGRIRSRSIWSRREFSVCFQNLRVKFYDAFWWFIHVWLLVLHDGKIESFVTVALNCSRMINIVLKWWDWRCSLVVMKIQWNLIFPLT